MMKSVELNDHEISRFIESTSYLNHEKPHQYESIRIKDDDIIFILYNSKKLVYEDNRSTNQLLKKIRKSNRKNYPKNNTSKKRYYHNNSRHNQQPYSNKKHKHKNNKNSYNKNTLSLSDYTYTIGSDETGKSEWYGPLVVTATATSQEENITLREIGVKDSKKIDKKQIPSLYRKIEKLHIKHETIILRPYSYNRLYNKFRNEGKNLNHLLAYLHSKCIKNLIPQINSDDYMVIIDKFDAKKMNQYLNTKTPNIIQESNAEKYTPVATSSIIAKYEYEKTLNQLEERYNINLSKKTKPYMIDKNILEKVAKTHFKNIARQLK